MGVESAVESGANSTDPLERTPLGVEFNVQFNTQFNGRRDPRRLLRETWPRRQFETNLERQLMAARVGPSGNEKNIAAAANCIDRVYEPRGLRDSWQDVQLMQPDLILADRLSARHEKSRAIRLPAISNGTGIPL